MEGLRSLQRSLFIASSCSLLVASALCKTEARAGSLGGAALLSPGIVAEPGGRLVSSLGMLAAGHLSGA